MRTSSHARRVTPSPPRRPLSGRCTLLSAAAIIACGLLSYAGSFNGVLVFDDEPAIAQNAHLRTLWPLGEAMRAPKGTTVSGRPVVSLTLAVNYAVAPRDARDRFVLPANASADEREMRQRNLWGYHAVNLAIHLAAALTLFGVLRRTLSMVTPAPASDSGVERKRRGPASARTPSAGVGSEQPRPASVSRERGSGVERGSLALTIALVWIVHPLNTAAVTYIVQRAESLMGLFLLLTLYCAIRAWSGRRWWLAIAVIACALGMGSKETMAVAPLLVLLWDWIFMSRVHLLRARLPLYLALGATWVILAVLVAGAHRPDAAGFGFAGWPWWRYLLTQAGVIVHYLRLAIASSPLVFDYVWPAARLVDVVPQLIVMLALAVWTAWGIARRTPAAFASGSFLLILAPTSSVLPIVTEVAAEHRMYVPLAAVLALLVAGVDQLVRRLPSGMVRPGAPLITAAALLLLGSRTHARNADYHDQERLWLDTVQKRPRNPRARNNYATLLVEQGRYREAEEHLRVATEIDPAAADAQQTLGVALCAQARCGEGLTHIEAAATLAPGSPDVQRNLGEAYASQGRMVEAVTHYQRALEARPDDVILLNRAGWILATDAGAARDGARAVKLAEHAVKASTRQDVESLDTLAAAYAELGRFDEATATAVEALQLAPTRTPEIIPELEQRLALYRARRPFRQ